MPNRLFLACVAAVFLTACSSPADRSGAPGASGSSVASAERARLRAEQPPDAESFGSTRNSRIAIDVTGRTRPLVLLAGDIPPDELRVLQDLAPNVRIISGLSRQTALQHAAEAHAVHITVLTPELLEQAKNLVWVQAFSAGVEHVVSMEALRASDDIVLTNLRAVHGPTIADHAMAMLLQLTRNLRHYANRQDAGEWDRGDTPWPSSALAGRTMLVVGLGGIGSEIAQRAHGFGMDVTATRRSGAAAPTTVRRVGSPSDLKDMLPEADVIAICVPLTDETLGLFDEAMLRAVKPGAILINIARGAVVDTDALVAALRSGRLAGACLDVTDPEPLPAGPPLWDFPNVVIKPHVAGDAALTQERRVALMRENLRRFSAGEPLLNVVDRTAGY